LSRDGKVVDPRLRRIRRAVLTGVWAVGLVTGYFGLLGAAARYGCSDTDNGFACRTSGSVAGVLILLAVIAIVTAVTVLAADRPARGLLTVAGIGLAALVLCFVAARSLLATA
jgi:hypothetical protein